MSSGRSGRDLSESCSAVLSSRCEGVGDSVSRRLSVSSPERKNPRSVEGWRATLPSSAFECAASGMMFCRRSFSLLSDLTRLRILDGGGESSSSRTTMSSESESFGAGLGLTVALT